MKVLIRKSAINITYNTQVVPLITIGDIEYQDISNIIISDFALEIKYDNLSYYDFNPISLTTLGRLTPTNIEKCKRQCIIITKTRTYYLYLGEAVEYSYKNNTTKINLTTMVNLLLENTIENNIFYSDITDLKKAYEELLNRSIDDSTISTSIGNVTINNLTVNEIAGDFFTHMLNIDDYMIPQDVTNLKKNKHYVYSIKKDKWGIRFLSFINHHYDDKITQEFYYHSFDSTGYRKWKLNPYNDKIKKYKVVNENYINSLSDLEKKNNILETDLKSLEEDYVPDEKKLAFTFSLHNHKDKVQEGINRDNLLMGNDKWMRPYAFFPILIDREIIRNRYGNTKIIQHGISNYSHQILGIGSCLIANDSTYIYDHIPLFYYGVDSVTGSSPREVYFLNKMNLYYIREDSSEISLFARSMKADDDEDQFIFPLYVFTNDWECEFIGGEIIFDYSMSNYYFDLEIKDTNHIWNFIFAHVEYNFIKSIGSYIETESEFFSSMFSGTIDYLPISSSNFFGFVSIYVLNTIKKIIFEHPTLLSQIPIFGEQSAKDILLLCNAFNYSKRMNIDITTINNDISWINLENPTPALNLTDYLSSIIEIVYSNNVKIENKFPDYYSSNEFLGNVFEESSLIKKIKNKYNSVYKQSVELEIFNTDPLNTIEPGSFISLNGNILYIYYKKINLKNDNIISLKGVIIA